jgi:hypothetical protein
LDNGNIGVGNASPPSNFTVTGANSSNAAAPQLLITATDTTERLRLGVNDGGNGTGFIQAWKEGTGAQNLTLNSEGGNVGIGTSSPGNKLSLVTSTLTDGIKSTGSSGSWNLLSPGMGAGGLNPIVTLNDNALIFSGGASGTGGLVLAPWAASSSGLRMDNTGKIGIGKSAPGSNLDVQGFTSYRGNPYTIASFAANATLAPLNITQGNSGGNPAISAGKNSAGFFDSLGFMTSDLERVKITAAGAVGIGTSSPTSILQVNGLLDVRGTTLTDGYVGLLPGTSTDSGYVAWHRPGNLQMGSMGSDLTNIRLLLKNGASFTVQGGSVGIATNSMQGVLNVGGTIVSVGSRPTGAGYARMFFDDAGKIVFEGYNTSLGGKTWQGFSMDGNPDIDFRSDRRLKKDIVDAEPMLGRLLQLPFRRYHWKDVTDANARPEFGVIAQEVEPLFPDLIGRGSDGMMTVGYTSFATIACKSIQELNQKMEDKIAQLETKLSEKEAETAALEARLSALENLIHSSR